MKILTFNKRMKLFAKIHFFSTMVDVQKRKAIFTLVVCAVSAFAVTAHAQGRLSQLQTELSNTTISGSVQYGFFGSFQNSNGSGNRPLQEFFHHQRNGNSLSPIPPRPLINSGGLIIIPVGASYPTGEGFYFTGAELMEASRSTTLFDRPVMPPIPPTPSQDSSSLFQSSSFVLMSIDSFYSQSASSSGSTLNFQTSSLTIQAVPEPSSFVLLAIGFLSGATIFRRRLARRSHRPIATCLCNVTGAAER